VTRVLIVETRFLKDMQAALNQALAQVEQNGPFTVRRIEILQWMGPGMEMHPVALVVLDRPDGDVGPGLDTAPSPIEESPRP